MQLNTIQSYSTGLVHTLSHVAGGLYSIIDHLCAFRVGIMRTYDSNVYT